MQYLNKLAETRILWVSFITTLLITLAFQVLINKYGVVLLDSISDPDQVRLAIAGMSEQQRVFHVWVTATLDVAYPLAYGAFLAGSAVRFFPSRGLVLAMPALICMPVDLIEGVVQVCGLLGVADWTEVKGWLTPLKQALFIVGLVITFCGWFKWLMTRLRPTH